VVYTLMVSNFVGICFARTLHYQFYVWYFHSVPFLLLVQAKYPLIIRLALLMAIEVSFNVFPATPMSSAVLQMAHLLILAGVRPPQRLHMVIAQERIQTK
jgi:alpha-1,3-mannosyltransferase